MFASLSSLSPQHALTLPAVAAINHLLAQEAWARALLMRHAGKDACIDAGLARLRMHVGRDGLLEAAHQGTAGDAPASVTIRVKPADLPLIAQDRTRALSYVKIEGDAEFANVISQLANGLRWDAEHDLERVVGPLGAHRLVRTARRTAGGATEATRRLAENLAEFLAEVFVEERPLLVRPHEVEEFGGGVVRLRDDVERTAKRIARLEQKLAQLDATPSIILTRADHHPDRR